ncbi:MAG: crotonase/enoyl-CoA hydratase family protein [Burkholderiaceae bacterium]|nr:crotonase/enoyl-CoA hydratase family protein [Burkholderiaceae bacterium]
MSQFELLRFERVGAVAHVQINRPEKRNALSDPLIAEIKQCMLEMPSDVGAIVIDGVGDHFSAGLDLSELRERTTAEGMYHSLSWHDAFHQVQFGRVPVISVLRGAVIGGGLELAASTHIRIAEPSAYYALPEGQRGLFVGGSGSVRIPRLIGFARMTDMMLTGRVYDAQEGQDIGLTQYLVDAGKGIEKAMALAERIAQNAPLTNYAVMHVLPRIASQPMAEGLIMESMIAAISSGDPEAKSRLAAFMEKRAAKVTRD